jgi:hypothetical protein
MEEAGNLTRKVEQTRGRRRKGDRVISSASKN